MRQLALAELWADEVKLWWLSVSCGSADPATSPGMVNYSPMCSILFETPRGNSCTFFWMQIRKALGKHRLMIMIV